MGDAKKSEAEKEYIPEIIEAEGSDGRPVWCFALIEAFHHAAYVEAHDKDMVDIKRNDAGVITVCLGGQRVGKVCEVSHTPPTEKQKEEFAKKSGIPCLKGGGDPGAGTKPPNPLLPGGPAP